VQTHRCFVVERRCTRLAQTVQLVWLAMQPVKALGPKRAIASAASWTWLVAETAGFASISVVSVRLRAACEVPEGSRLVVHEVRNDAYAGELPLASMQRVLTRDALRRGLDLQLFRPSATPQGGTRIEAWVDSGGDEELEFDGVRAKPHHAALVGRGDVHREHATLVLEPVSKALRAA
jgi:hypothetical protein